MAGIKKNAPDPSAPYGKGRSCEILDKYGLPVPSWRNPDGSQRWEGTHPLKCTDCDQNLTKQEKLSLQYDHTTAGTNPPRPLCKHCEMRNPEGFDAQTGEPIADPKETYRQRYGSKGGGTKWG